ncbi:membrane protein [Streptomyces sp. NRRL F-6491]|nr:membrane protein [Streptomyces sp. NRRL F-6491]KOX52733.1 membrane protein [Streptomyces sp. NRRL F-6492]
MAPQTTTRTGERVAEAADIKGTGPSPARRWLRRTLTVAVGAPLLAGLLQAPVTTSPAAAAPSATAAEDATGSKTVDVSLDTLTPNTPVEGDTVTLTGTVTNRGRKAVTDGVVELRVGPRMTSRSEIEQVTGRTGYRDDSDPAPVPDAPTAEIPKLGAGLSADFSLSVPVADLGLDEAGVYQLGVSLTGETPDRPYPRVLGIERTFLPYQPEATEKKTQITYLWPLIASAHVSAETATDDQQTPVFEDDALAAELRPGGRLDQMVSLGKDLPVTWVIDPDLLATVDAMANGYRVKDGSLHVPGTNKELAERWLGKLEKAVQGHKVVALPFADPDLASLAHHGKDVPGSLGHLQSATALAGVTVETVLHVQPSTDFAWPVDGAVDPAIVSVATSAGADKVIARSDSVRDDLSYTPTAARPLGNGSTTAVVSDALLSTAFEGDMVRAERSTLAVQEFLSQSLAITLEQPEKQRSVVVAPQRVPTVAQAQTMATALRGLSGRRWSQPSDLFAAATAKPDPNASTAVPGSSRYPKKLRDRELPVQAFRDMKTTRDELNDFKVVLTFPDRVVTPFGNAINREMSTSWRGQTRAATIYRVNVQGYLQRLTKSIQLVDKSDLTLSGRSATIPVTVQNKLLQGVDHLVLRLASNNGNRLEINGERIAELPVKVGAGHSQSVKFDATANVNGQVPVTAQLYTEDGTPYGKPMSFTVKVSEITPTVMLVIAGGVLLLVLAGVRMYSQRKRLAAQTAEADAAGETEVAEGAEGAEKARETEGAGADEPDAEPGEDDADGPEQPSDPTPDTGSESGDPSATGEKVDR